MEVLKIFIQTKKKTSYILRHKVFFVMSFKFIVKNFQSIEYQEFFFKDFSLLVGTSNLGKSALVRALRSLLYCEFEKSYVRVDSDTSELELIFENENKFSVHSIKYIRSYLKNINSYRITYLDGSIKDFEKVGINPPEELKALGFNLISVDKLSYSLNPNFQSQLEGLFMFNVSNTDMSSFFNKIFNVDKFEVALRECNKDILNFTKDFNLEKKELNDLKFSLNDLKKETELKKVEFEKAKELKEKYETLKRLLVCIDKINFLNKELIIVNESSSKIKETISKFEKINKNLSIIRNLKRLSDKKMEFLLTSKKILEITRSLDKFKLSMNLLKSYMSLRRFRYFKLNYDNKISLLNDVNKYSIFFKDSLSSLRIISHLKRLLSLKNNWMTLSSNCNKLEDAFKIFSSLKNKMSLIKNLISIKKLKLLLDNKESSLKILSMYDFSILKGYLEKYGLVCKSCGQKTINK